MSKHFFDTISFATDKDIRYRSNHNLSAIIGETYITLRHSKKPITEYSMELFYKKVSAETYRKKNKISSAVMISYNSVFSYGENIIIPSDAEEFSGSANQNGSDENRSISTKSSGGTKSFITLFLSMKNIEESTVIFDMGKKTSTAYLKLSKEKEAYFANAIKVLTNPNRVKRLISENASSLRLGRVPSFEKLIGEKCYKIRSDTLVQYLEKNITPEDLIIGSKTFEYAEQLAKNAFPEKLIEEISIVAKIPLSNRFVMLTIGEPRKIKYELDLDLEETKKTFGFD